MRLENVSSSNGLKVESTHDNEEVEERKTTKVYLVLRFRKAAFGRVQSVIILYC